MIDVSDKKNCCGCSACYNVCPVNAITMAEDNEGFLYPHIDESKCVKCGKCVNSCPYHAINNPAKDLRLCYAAYNINEGERSVSSSGGIFTLLAKRIIDEGGIVFGAAYDENFEVYHTFTENKKDLAKLIGSKYMQSRIGHIFEDVKRCLAKGRTVLFAGTTCQIGGLKGYLKKEYDNLLCVDFICLGIPSPKVWRDYLSTYFSGEKVQLVNFKNKSLGWHNFSLNIITDKRDFCVSGRNTYFFSGYFKGLYSRPSCSVCIFKSGSRVSDITIADCWGYDHIAPELDDNKGLSSIVCHSEKGQALFESIKNMLVWKRANFDDVLRYNNNYCTPSPMGLRRETFWKDYDRLPKEKVLKKYCKPEKQNKMKTFISGFKKRMKKAIGF